MKKRKATPFKMAGPKAISALGPLEPYAAHRPPGARREGTAAAFGVSVDLEIEEGFPLLVNDPGCVEVVARVAADVSAIDTVSSEDLPIAGGEDFAYFAANRPSAYFLLGAGREGEDTPTCHHPDFDFDDELLAVGIEFFLRIVNDRLSRGWRAKCAILSLCF